MRFLRRTLTSQMQEWKPSRRAPLIRSFGIDNKVLFSSFVPASPGDGSLSFFGIVFDNARIKRVQITTATLPRGRMMMGKMT